ncbi:hypothetical protein F4780DRAFT_764904 [Xylariomycetidae sp. FL0641]|nr:hypothetical protein F4780DRAFT_764904 [Xylariomycetidae sp. FL0641]
MLLEATGDGCVLVSTPCTNTLMTDHQAGAEKTVARNNTRHSGRAQLTRIGIPHIARRFKTSSGICPSRHQEGLDTRQLLRDPGQQPARGADGRQPAGDRERAAQHPRRVADVHAVAADAVADLPVGVPRPAAKRFGCEHHRIPGSVDDRSVPHDHADDDDNERRTRYSAAPGPRTSGHATAEPNDPARRHAHHHAHLAEQQQQHQQPDTTSPDHRRGTPRHELLGPILHLLGPLLFLLAPSPLRGLHPAPADAAAAAAPPVRPRQLLRRGADGGGAIGNRPSVVHHQRQQQ